MLRAGAHPRTGRRKVGFICRPPATEVGAFSTQARTLPRPTARAGASSRAASTTATPRATRRPRRAASRRQPAPARRSGKKANSEHALLSLNVPPALERGHVLPRIRPYSAACSASAVCSEDAAQDRLHAPRGWRTQRETSRRSSILPPDLPTSPHISPTSPHISPHLPTQRPASRPRPGNLTTSPHTSPYLPMPKTCEPPSSAVLSSVISRAAWRGATRLGR